VKPAAAHISSGTVQTANSLQGAVLIQGVMLATRLRQQSPKVPITEAHPKALIKFLNLDDGLDQYWTAASAKFEIHDSMPTSPHECDAVLAAVAARNGVTKKWSRDLSVSRGDSELDPKQTWFGEVSYFWPD
jgi:hypothetical protein